jgi:hypothetical protein
VDSGTPAFQVEEEAMAVCEVCGNDYALSFEVTAQGNRHAFDCFECAIQRLAPICEHCSCRIIGHGVGLDGHFYCCAHCARESGGQRAGQLVDAVGSPTSA